MARKNTFNKDETVAISLRLLELVSTAPGKRMGTGALKRELDIDDAALEEFLGLINSVSNSENGARAILVLDQGAGCVQVMDSITDVGFVRAGITAPALLNVLINQGDHTPDDEQVIAAAFGTLVSADDSFVAAGNPYGRFHAALEEAIDDGIRCRILYASARDGGRARWRTVDPCAIDHQDQRNYLIAWDVQEDGQRRYRLDLVQDVSFTDDSVAAHDYHAATIRESLERGGVRAVVELVHPERLAQINWKNARLLDASGTEAAENPSPGAAARYEVFYDTEEWLFERVLAAGGDIVITEPDGLKQRFIAYAKKLLVETNC